MAAITRCVDMEGTFDESNLVLMGGFPADFTKVQAMEEIQFVAKHEGWVLDGDALDLQLGKSSWKLLQFNGLSGSFALVIQLEKAIRASVAPSWAKREYGLVNSRTGQLKQGGGSNWAHIYAIQVLPAGFDVSLLSDPTVAFFARMPMEYDAVTSSALYEFRRVLAERGPVQRKRYLSIVIRTIHPVPYYAKNARGELVGSARSKSIGQMIVAQLVFGTSTEPLVSSLRTLFGVPRSGTSVTHASFHSSGLTFEVFPDLWRLRPSALYPLDSPSLVAVPALLVSGFAEDLMPTTILQRLCFSNLINDEKVLNVIVLRRAKSKELLRLGYPQVDSLLLIGEGIRSSEPHLAAGETITLIDSAIPGLSKFRDHNADYVAFTDKKAGRAPALVVPVPLVTVAEVKAIRDPELMEEVSSLRAVNTELAVRYSALEANHASLKERVDKLFKDTSQTNTVVQEVQAELGTVKALQEGMMTSQDELKAGQKELLSLRDQDVKDAANKEAMATELRRSEAEDLKQGLAAQLEAFDLAQKELARTLAVETKEKEARAAKERADERAEDRALNERRDNEMKAFLTRLLPPSAPAPSPSPPPPQDSDMHEHRQGQRKARGARRA